MTGRRLHFIAIGGAGMSGLALVCRQLGADVTGSDRAECSYLEHVRAAGIEPTIGHDADAVPADAEVVVSTAIGDDNPELARARERGQRVIHRGELLAELCAERRLIAVAGTHGKTTTAGMLAHALRAIGADPAFLLGGELPGAATRRRAANAGWGRVSGSSPRPTSATRASCSCGPRWPWSPTSSSTTTRSWASRAELLDAFRRFAEPAAGLALIDDPGLDTIAAGRPALRFGGWALAPELRARTPAGIREAPARLSLARPRAPQPARTRARRWPRSSSPGSTSSGAAAALADFPGMLRRLERKGTRSGAVVYDDYAHHPTEVAAALAALRELGPRRLIAVFQPHLYSRTKALAARFGAALAAADEIGVLDVYPAREEPVGELAGVSGLGVAEAAADPPAAGRSGGCATPSAPSARSRRGSATATCWSRSAPATSSSRRPPRGAGDGVAEAERRRRNAP